MSLRNDPLYAEAIIFFEDRAVIKEMLYVEFQAVLDGVVGIPEFARKKYQAAYVTIWQNLGLNTVVLFELRFDNKGHVDSQWDLPLRALARNATRGPDLGSGPIHLMSRISCEQADYAAMLWDAKPHEVEILTSLRDAVLRNKLGLYAQEDRRRYGDAGARRRPSRAVMEVDEDDFQQQLIHNIEATLKFKYDQQLRVIEQQHEEIVRQLEAQTNNLLAERDAQQGLLSDLEDRNKEHVDIIAAKYRAKLERELVDTQSRLEEALNLKELELSYSQDSEKQLREEIEELETSIETEREKFLEAYIKELVQCGVEFIITESGIGSYSLKADQLDNYLRNPTGFWARQCGVSEADYLGWWHHYKDPVCQAGRTTGCQCRAEVQRIKHPTDFAAGIDDMCGVHRLKRVGESF